MDMENQKKDDMQEMKDEMREMRDYDETKLGGKKSRKTRKRCK